MYKGYLDQCIDSELMRNYLKKTKISSSAIVDLVMYSLIPIGQKREELIKLLNDARERNDDELVCDCNTGIEYIDTATHYLEGDGIFSLENNYYEEADYDNYSYFVGNFARYQDAQEYIAIENNNEDLQYECGKWNCGAVKHGAVSYDYSPKPSFLYRSKIYTGELSEEEKVLQLVSEYLHGDEEKGRDLYDRIVLGSLTSNELRYIIEKV